MKTYSKLNQCCKHLQQTKIPITELFDSTTHTKYFIKTFICNICNIKYYEKSFDIEKLR